MSDKHKAVVLLSGGLDSTVLAYHLKDQGYDVHGLSVLYGQRHRRELQAARRVAFLGGFEQRLVDLGELRGILGGSSQTDDAVAVPQGHYADETMRLTVVPNRNMLLISCAVAYAISLQAPVVAYAAHAGDHAVYPDCRHEFVTAMIGAIALCDYAPPMLLSPFVEMTKAEVVSRGADLGVPFVETWSCYEGKAQHCGRCGTCTERIGAFADAGVVDPTAYDDKDFALRMLKEHATAEGR